MVAITVSCAARTRVNSGLPEHIVLDIITIVSRRERDTSLQKDSLGGSKMQDVSRYCYCRPSTIPGVSIRSVGASFYI
jgi:hypothetical protein